MDEQGSARPVVCGRCGATAPGGSRFCGTCGAALGTDQADTVTLPDPGTSQPGTTPAAETAPSGPSGIPVGGVARQGDGRFAQYRGLDAYGRPVWTQARPPVGGYYYQYVDAATGYRTAWYTPTEPTVATGAYPAAYGSAAGYGTPGVPPAYPAGPYAAQPAYGTAQPGTNGLAIASLVLGIVWVYWVGSVLALVFGYVALSQIKRTGQGGRGMAIAGIVLGWIGCAFLVVAIVAAIVAATNAPSYTY